ncbi:MAG: glutamate--cysteine ligase, partial [Betaproteobacteria bacterium]
NRFQACRHGLAGVIIDPRTKRGVPIADDIRDTLRALAPHAAALESEGALDRLMALTLEDGNDATWLRSVYAETKTLPDVVRRQAARWMGER